MAYFFLVKQKDENMVNCEINDLGVTCIFFVAETIQLITDLFVFLDFTYTISVLSNVHDSVK